MNIGNPISTAWSLDTELRKENCLNLATHAFAVAAISIVSHADYSSQSAAVMIIQFLDIVVLMLPMSKLIELPISIRQKIA